MRGMKDGVIPPSPGWPGVGERSGCGIRPGGAIALGEAVQGNEERKGMERGNMSLEKLSISIHLR